MNKLYTFSGEKIKYNSFCQRIKLKFLVLNEQGRALK